MSRATGTFDVELTPAEAELDGAVNRFMLEKTFHGGIDGHGIGVMLSGGDPASGAAGYVAIETVTGVIDGRQGSFVLQQFGQMHAGSQSLSYAVVPGSGQGELSGITGEFHLVVEDNGTHRYELDDEL